MKVLTGSRDSPAISKGTSRGSVLRDSRKSSPYSPVQISKGGNQPSQSSSPQISRKSIASKTSLSTRNKQLVELMAAMYPGMKIGHKECVPPIVMVPKRMGWLWNTEDTADGQPFPRGWRPGAISAGVIKYFNPLTITGGPTTPISTKSKKVKQKLSDVNFEQKVSILPAESELPPTLCVRKEKGVYRVTMQAIKDSAAENQEEQPVQFKIPQDSASSCSGTTQSSSTIKIDYFCTGARREPPRPKPRMAEMSTQYEIITPKKPEVEKVEVVEVVKTKGKKKRKSKTPNKDEINAAANADQAKPNATLDNQQVQLAGNEKEQNGSKRMSKTQKLTKK